ncbi:MAG: NADPH-dependent F420 reductase, partial [Promethearchaeota archaeon]
GEKINLGSRQEEKGVRIATELNEKIGKDLMIGMENSQAIAESDIVLLTIPISKDPQNAEKWLVEFVSGLTDHLKSGSIFVDVTVPLVFEKGFVGLHTLSEPSVTEILRKKVIPEDIPVVGAFKTLSAEKLNDTETYPTLDYDVFICGPKEPKKIVIEIAKKIPNLRPVNAGGIKYARYCEMLTAFAIGINKRYKIKDSGYRILGI